MFMVLVVCMLIVDWEICVWWFVVEFCVDVICYLIDVLMCVLIDVLMVGSDVFVQYWVLQDVFECEGGLCEFDYLVDGCFVYQQIMLKFVYCEDLKLVVLVCD